MTAICPEGHESSTADYCDQCGRPIAAPPTEVLSAVEEADTSTSTSTSPGVREKQCPKCANTCPRNDSFCEECGYDFSAPPDQPPAGREAAGDRPAWEIVVSIDLDWFRRSRSDGVAAPTAGGDCTYQLQKDRLLVGRGNGSTSGPQPEIPVEDPGVSRRHATLECQEDGSYVVRDVGSTNGTFINNGPAQINRDEPVPLTSDDEIHIGAWTTLKLRAV